MAVYQINKGVGRSVEFKGLKAQYLFIFTGGLLGVFIAVVVLYMFGVNQYLCLFTGGIGGGVLVWKTFSLNATYGAHGLMKMGARKRHPKYISHKKSITAFVHQKESHEKYR